MFFIKNKSIQAPLSPKPWYKRSLRGDTVEKKNKEKKTKAASPENLPEIPNARETIKIQVGIKLWFYHYSARKFLNRILAKC